MSIDPTDSPKQTAASLMADIISDVQLLFEQQLKLMQYEFEEEVHRRTVAMTLVASGVAIAFIAATILCVMFAHLLHWATSPIGTDPAWLPMWACYGIVTAVLITTSTIMVWMGRKMLSSHHAQSN
ncbi:phage holin family protein [Schlesneria paludicola]|uniref:phage holin family protein n=1 Tax=Schlesneria paludicola TaxID=360056 RepID=UPI00029B54B0|nr:phage holin family protein [Schlesneria paludicola]